MLIKKLQKVTIAMLVTAMILPLNVSQAKSQNVYRISGRTRIATSAEISKSVYSTSENVVLASGYNFADALSAGQLASALDAPLLLSSKDKLDSETEGEINRLKAKNVYIVGGNLTIKKSSIDSYLKKKNIKVTRLEGNNRYKTSEKVMEKTKEFINPEYLLIASGKDFPDALAATGFMVNHKSVMVLSDGNSYPKSNLKEIAIGGKMQLPLDKFKGERISGRSRYETALAIAKRSFNDNENVVLASGQVFADSLSAVSLTKKHNAPIILTEFENLTKNTKEYLNKRENIYIVGGFKTIDKDILANITSEEKYEIQKYVNKKYFETGNVPSKAEAKKKLDSSLQNLQAKRKQLSSLNAQLKKQQEEDKKNKERIKAQIKSLEDEAKQLEEKNKPIIAEANKKISDVDKLLPKINERIKEGAFAFLPWVAENYPEYKDNANKGLAILNEFYQKGDVKKTPEDASAYENLLITADYLEELNKLRLNDENFKGLKKFDTNFEILAKSIVSCNRSLDYTLGHRGTFSVWENLAWGYADPFKGWYFEEKEIYNELLSIVKEKYSDLQKNEAMDKAMEDYKKAHNLQDLPVIGHYTHTVAKGLDVTAVTRNLKGVQFSTVHCMDSDSIWDDSPRLSEGKYREIINAYVKSNDKKYLLEEKAKAQKTIKDIENEKISRKQKIENLKKGNTDKIIKIKQDIKLTEEEIQKAEKNYNIHKVLYDKVK
ncbi:hypothetical protein B9N57_00240 [Finegoldia magna]|nr:cell wall-binding repeat-containing protein [Finegoldia magna]OXZ31827.1 hypothetical protein B9N57_00240 [Finegoldia magna]